MLCHTQHPAALFMLPTTSEPKDFKASLRVPPFVCILDISLKLMVVLDLCFSLPDEVLCSGPHGLPWT